VVGQFHALALAALLALPLALLLGRRFDPHVPAAERAFEAVVTGLERWYPWLVVGVAVWLAFGIARESLALHHNVESAILLSIVLGCAAAARSCPLAGPTAFCVLNYTFGRDDTVTVTLTELGAPSLVAALSVGAMLVWRRQHARGRPLPGGSLVWSAALLAAWLAVAVGAAVFAGRPVDPDVTWRATRYSHAAALFLVAACCRPGLRDLRLMVLALSAALIVRQVFLTSYWLLEQNLAMLTVVTVPVALAIASCRPLSPLQIPLAVGAAYMSGLILFVQNRGAVVGLAAAAIGLWPLARRRWLGLLVLATVPMGAAYWAWDAGLLDRFYAVYDDGRFVGTAAQRLEIWRNGLEIAREHPIVGFGPGNFEFALRTFTSGRMGFGAHNSVVELLVEAGAPALVFYLAVFALGAGHLFQVARRFRGDWRRTAAAGVLGSIAAHLTAGMFLSNPSLVWTWILLGLAVSLSGGETARPDWTEPVTGRSIRSNGSDRTSPKFSASCGHV
jgi:O-antigen ligase